MLYFREERETNHEDLSVFSPLGSHINTKAHTLGTRLVS